MNKKINNLNVNTLKNKFKQLREVKNFSEDFRLRIHRAISWLKKAEVTEDLDIKFIALWISFNAAYAKELSGLRAMDKATFLVFIRTVCNLDNRKLLQNAIWENLSENITYLLNDHYTHQPFWKKHNGLITENEWKDQFIEKNQSALEAIKNRNTRKLLVFVFEHLYVLRNQIIHGGSTYNSKANRKQLAESCKILATLVPIIIDIMMKHPNEEGWGKPFYPYIPD